jgi:putative oxidoreductase
MPPMRRIAQSSLASVFITEGLDAMRNPIDRVKAAEAITVPLRRRFPALPQDGETLVRCHGTIQAGAGVLLAFGRFRRIAAATLIASLLATTYAEHRFWEEPDDESRREERLHLLKNVGLLGGLLLVVIDPWGVSSLSWRVRRGSTGVGKAIAIGLPVVADYARDLTATSAGVLSHAAPPVIDVASSAVRGAKGLTADLARFGSGTLNHAGDQTLGVVSNGMQRVSEAAERMGELPRS